MITKKQHLEICQYVQRILDAKIPVFTYEGQRVLSVDMIEGAIRISNATKITWRSYAPRTRLRGAYAKFHVKEMTLHQLRKASAPEHPGFITITGQS